MKIINTSIDDVKIIQPKVFGDDRGYFFESFNQKIFNEKVCRRNFIQDNESYSKKGTLRGLHIQTKNTQGKLVRVVEGEVFDVAVDCRANSSTKGKVVFEFLSAENKKQLWIPEGFAHGFLVVSTFAKFIYKCTDIYNPKFEHSIKWDDEDLGIPWPDSITNISEKDKNGITFQDFLKLW